MRPATAAPDRIVAFDIGVIVAITIFSSSTSRGPSDATLILGSVVPALVPTGSNACLARAAERSFAFAMLGASAGRHLALKDMIAVVRVPYGRALVSTNRVVQDR